MDRLSVFWLAVAPDTPGRGYWDHGFLSDYLFPQFDCDHQEVSEIPEGVDGAVVVLPARNQAEFIEKINVELNLLRWCVLLLTGDEESVFPFDQIDHPNIRVWVMSAKQGQHDGAANLFGSGYREEEPVYLKEIGLQDRPLDWFFSGQITHPVREQCAEQLRTMPNGKLLESKGFGQGLEHREYVENLARAKFVPAPSGPCTPDNFRLYEALEAGCVPIADGGNYWSYLFGETVPFPVVSSWDVLPELLPELLKDYPRLANLTFGWWQMYKRRMADKLHDNVQEVSGQTLARVGDDVTVVIPTNPIISAPSTEVIEETIASVRENFPYSEIIVMFDGVVPELAELKAGYDEYTRRLLYKIKYEYTNVVPLVFEQHSHQSLMMREALKYIRTPMVMFVEHDTPIVGEIDWPGIKEVVRAGYSNMVRLHHETHVLPDHQHLQLDRKPKKVLDVPLIRTVQWSQRPHLASTDFYRRIIDTYHDDQPRFIEHVMYGVLLQNDWNDFRTHLYAPPDNMRRSAHLDGRRYVASE